MMSASYFAVFNYAALAAPFVLPVLIALARSRLRVLNAAAYLFAVFFVTDLLVVVILSGWSGALPLDWMWYVLPPVFVVLPLLPVARGLKAEMARVNESRAVGGPTHSKA